MVYPTQSLPFGAVQGIIDHGMSVVMINNRELSWWYTTSIRVGSYDKYLMGQCSAHLHVCTYLSSVSYEVLSFGT